MDDKLVVSGLPAKSNKKSPYLEITQPIKKNKKKNYLFKTKDEEDQKAWVSSIRNSFVKVFIFFFSFFFFQLHFYFLLNFFFQKIIARNKNFWSKSQCPFKECSRL